MTVSPNCWITLVTLDYIVDIGGEVKNPRQPNRKRHRLERCCRRAPNSPNNENAYVVGLKDYAVATSGDYRNFFYYKEKRYSHTISPKDGYPVEHNLASVTVFHPSCMRADALATAIMAMGGKTEQPSQTNTTWQPYCLSGKKITSLRRFYPMPPKIIRRIK